MTAPGDSPFGILPADEGLHPHDPELESWNESIFYDFVSRDGRTAGHVRVGRMPGQGRVWAWCFLAFDGAWLAYEAPFLPLELARDFDVDAPGFTFAREIVAPLVDSRTMARGRGVFVSGPRAGEEAPFSFDLRFEALGPCHSIGDRGVEGHTSDDFETNRFEQPVRVVGEVVIDGTSRSVEGFGERDHSWGPRDWNIEWTFLALSGPERQTMAVRVQFDEETFFDTGYLAGSAMRTVEEAEFALSIEPSRVAGRVCVRDDAGRELRGALEPLSQARIDASHAFSPPQPSDYRRTLVRFVPDDGGAPLFGFLETNRFPHGFPVPQD